MEQLIKSVGSYYDNLSCHEDLYNIWDKEFKNGPSKICERQP